MTIDGKELGRAVVYPSARCSGRGMDDGLAWRRRGLLPGNRDVGSELSTPTNLMRSAMKVCAFPKSVHVRRYTRFRKGRAETVCEHCRGPRQ